MNFNFGQARIAAKQGLGGETIMRFDDTNPVRCPLSPSRCSHVQHRSVAVTNFPRGRLCCSNKAFSHPPLLHSLARATTQDAEKQEYIDSILKNVSEHSPPSKSEILPNCICVIFAHRDYATSSELTFIGRGTDCSILLVVIAT